MKKLLAIILVFSLLFLSACNEGSDNTDRPDVNLSNSDFIEIGDVNLEQQYDNTGAFSYISFRARRNIRPYFKNNDEFPGSIFIYQTNTPHIDDVKLYGYMDNDFQTLTNPISLSPNVFAMGLTKVHADDGDYIIDDNFVPVTEICPGFALVGNSIIKVSWEEEHPDFVTYISDLDADSDLIPVKVDTGTFNDEGKITRERGYYTMSQLAAK